MRRAVALALAVALLGAAAAEATHGLRPSGTGKRVRVFAVGPKFDLAWVDTREDYRAKLLALMDRERRGPGAPPIQRGADDVASHRLGPEDPARPVQTARDLVALPEDIGLMAVFAGVKGSLARSAPSITEAIAGVLAAYGPESAYYAARHPELATRGLPTRLLFLATTDQLVRTGVETFAELADAYDVWLVAGVNMPRAWRVVCADRDVYVAPPGGAPCEEENAAKVALLRAPDEPARTYAYEATTAAASNMALVFDPDGRLVSKQVKTYLTPVELPGQLDLLPGDVSTGLGALETPVGTLGFVTSKDAWMPDVTTKLDQRGVDVLVQPEFFVNDTVMTTGPWAPDTIAASGYSDVLRHPSMEALVLPELTGNVFDFSADNQQAIAVKPRSVLDPPRGGLVGQPPSAGYTKVQEWVVPDPVAPGEPMAERRRRLGEAGERLLPRDSSPPCPDPAVAGPCRGGQVEGVIFDDVEVARRPAYRRRAARKRGATRFSVNRPVAPRGRAQRNVTLAARGRVVYAAFEERDGAGWRVVVARSPDGGRTWTRRLTGLGTGAANEWWPSLAAGPGGNVWLAWQDDRDGAPRVHVARLARGGRALQGARPVDDGPAPGVHQWRPAIAATGPARAFVAWIDERGRFAGDDLPQAALYGARVDGDGPGRARRLDSAAPPDPLARTLDHAWAPDVAADGDRVAVTWIDFRHYDWDVFARESADGGTTFGDERQVNPTPPAVEALNDRPQAALGPGGALVAYTDWAKDVATPLTPSPLYDTVLAAPGRDPVQVDTPFGARSSDGEHHSSTFAPALLAGPGGDALVAWQDHRRGPGDILLSRTSAEGVTGPALRVDDSGRRGWNQWRPALARSGARVVAAWEDERDGPPQVYAATAAARRLR